MVRVHLWGTLQSAAGGNPAVEVEARTIRELFNALEDAHPGLKPHIAAGIAVSINGTIYRDSWFQPLPEAAEIVLLPRIAGG